MSKKFRFSWAHDSRSFKPSRWRATTHTFNGITCQFDPDLVKEEDGQLILLLSPPDDDDAEQARGKVLSATMVNQTLIRLTFGDGNKSYANRKNYKIDGVQVMKTKLHTDHKTLDLIVKGLETGKNYQLKFISPDKNVQLINISTK